MKTLGIIGADGRMGQAVGLAAQKRYDIVARISKDDADYPALSQCDVVIDFSVGSALVQALPHFSDGTALVSGTTGLSPDEERAISNVSARLPLLRSGNFSIGIAVLCALARQAAASLGDDWDVEVLEMHHRHKVDAPSGTALMLGEALAKGRGVTLSDVAAHERAGARRIGDIGFSVLRGGGIYGDHEVRIVSESEQITLGHRALNRQVFADGAVQAADWLLGRPAGLYSLEDMITV
ncbi:4-hydroxy-tetrahydrodipicolinate reductase [Algimonas porphyrae]|uniref:4-hydroxy-tetrahydrodipicolinate reductase n=1 Tax=Algimonas porphyrae TaxID=1128113 RepID=A0ABQ5UZJ1_9PROT|nr:4-hydroxy-tetrahydrodipicolinate reductase [Algimonas porphyrae]GLQ20703.1 4-hydroxy-tetrahydrodipicolinate reductase [Algimonas porphyrae]